MTSTIAGSSSIITILAIKSQRGEYFSFEKKKAVLRICLVRPNSEPDRQSSTNSPADRKQRARRIQMSILRRALRSDLREILNEFCRAHFPDATRRPNSP